MDKLDHGYLSTLVERTKAGSSDAFAELYAATYKKQYAFACRYLRDEYLAQDATQEVYILALRNIGKLKEGRVFVSWLNQISFRICFDMAAKNNRHATELSIPELEASHVQQSEGSPGDAISSLDEQQYIKEKIMGLPRLESQVVIMKYYNNMKLEDIATSLDCNISTVKRHLQSGRTHLAHTLRDMRKEGYNVSIQ